MIEFSHKQEPWYVPIAPSYIEEDRLQLPLLVRWGEEIVQVDDPINGEPRTEFRYHAVRITYSVPWPVSESDIPAILEAARPELEQRAQNAEALEDEFHG